MHCMNRDNLVQDSYLKSFEIRKDLEEKIQNKEEELKKVEEKNKGLKSMVEGQCFN